MALGPLDPLNVRRQLGSLAAGALHTRGALLPLPVIDRRGPVSTDALPPFERRPAAALRGKRVAVVGSSGGGACVALVGVARALEEAGADVEAISTCSASTLWGAMWAGGLTADEMADLSLRWRPEDHLAIQWTGLPRFALSAMRGFAGLARGRALEALFGRRLWRMAAGETELALHAVVLNLDRGRLEHFGTATTPDLTLGELARISVAPPAAGEAVRVEGDLYVDGGAVDLFPAEPLIEDGGFDHVVGLNVTLPPGLDGAPATRARELDEANHLELARRGARRLGDSLVLVEPIDPAERRGAGFYDLFLDRRRWPELIRRGHRATVEALRPLRRRRAGRRRSTTK